jgi:protein-S-isoprenylcysteine O-methyltransferase Ste14
MNAELFTIILHQLLFQGMFFAKNILLKRRLDDQIRGWNKEATISISFFLIFIITTIVLTTLDTPIGSCQLLDPSLTYVITTGLLILNLTISVFSLIHLRDSWRVGVIEKQQTELITTGIYSLTRNPYFLSYNIMFVSYALLLQNTILVILTIIGFLLVHWMILKEESYLRKIHRDQYDDYCSEVSRYILF